jgi:hypothetical protein
VSKLSADGQPEDRSMERKRVTIKEIRQKESTAESGQSTVDKGSIVGF